MQEHTMYTYMYIHTCMCTDYGFYVYCTSLISPMHCHLPPFLAPSHSLPHCLSTIASSLPPSFPISPPSHSSIPPSLSLTPPSLLLCLCCNIIRQCKARTANFFWRNNELCQAGLKPATLCVLDRCSIN